ncbi:DUF3696 domain-containing protein [Chitinophaga sp. NPDC101104]|uniref:DUF3696 domain-containing protein n=1 Tax=Chitinophaga sp. NPDC101104 TaxID=3390561 RepID=UPI003D05304D
MIHELDIKNFKAWAASGKIRMAPLTIFCGNNSSGKSSIAQFLLMLKQTIESYDRQRVLHLGDEKSLVDLGVFHDVVHNHNVKNNLEFKLSFDTDEITITDAVKGKQLGSYTQLEFEAKISSPSSEGIIQLKKFLYTLPNGHPMSFGLQLDKGKYKLITDNYSAKRQKGRAWNVGQPENFFGFPNEAVAYYQNTGFLQDLSLAIINLFKSMYYVGPLRGHPKRVYQFSGQVPPDVGEKGEQSINAILAAKSQGRMISKGFKQKSEQFDVLIARWLVQMGLIHSFRVIPITKGRIEHEVKIKINANSPEVLITDVGFGISQILPVIVQCFYVKEESILFFEQPEIHLHPSVQAHLGDLFIEAIHSRENGQERNTQIVVESHSEHLIRRIQRRIAEEKLNADDVALYFITQESGEAKLIELEVDSNGNIKNWPNNFFGDDLEDLRAMTYAAMKRKTSKK